MHTIRKMHSISSSSVTSLVFTLMLLDYITIYACGQAITVERVSAPVSLGEGPHWDVRTQTLYFVDILGQKILRYNPSNGQVTHAAINGDGLVGLSIPIEGEQDKFVVAKGKELVQVTWDSSKNESNPKIEKIVTLDKYREGTRINDGKCDALGRLWVGTMAIKVNGTVEPHRGSLYKVNLLHPPTKVLKSISIGNGLAWNKANDKMYYIDSQSYQIWSYDYQKGTGVLRNRRVVFDLKQHNISGIPDGMTVDVDDNLWIAVFDGSCVLNVNPKTSELIKKIDFPVREVTSVAFGGPQLDILYVTTAREDMTEAELEEKPDSGSLYAIKGLGTEGLPANKFRKMSFGYYSKMI